MIAKTKRCLDAMLSLLHEKKIEKIYHAIAIGTPEPKRGTIEKKLLRIEEARHEAKVQVDETNGQNAITHYRTLREYGKYSLLECRLETGRTHQIRVHLSAIGHPILGDTAYGNPHENAFLRRTIGLSRQMLHAFSLSFRHPITEKILTITAPYPEDFQ
jgi:23S rRNA pseudouridine1911/1915/1917 synthase